MRVMQLRLDKNHESVIDKKIFDQNVSYLSEPTQGLIIRNVFFYIGNSPWGAYDKNMRFQEEQLEPVQVRKVKLRP
jgi:hypothetical protein